MTVDFDTILHRVGDFDRYQKFMYFLICLPASFPSAWSAFNQVFVAAIPEHYCNVGEWQQEGESLESLQNRTIPWEFRDGAWKPSRCLQFNLSAPESTEGIPCQNGWTYDRTTYLTTIVTDFNLVCDLKFWPSLCTTIFYVGSFVGNLLFGYVADKWGRRASFFSLLTIQVVTGTASAFSPDIFSFTALRFIVGLTFPALYQIPFVIGMELMGPDGRIFAGVIVSTFFGGAMCLLGITASAIRKWQLLTIICNAPFAILFSYWWFLPESPRWLVTVSRCEEAKEVVLKIAKCNKRDVSPESIHRQCVEVSQKCRSDSQEQEDRHNLTDLFRTPNLRKKTCIITFIWFVNAVVYNGLTYNVSNLPVNDYLSFAINGAVELPAYFVLWPLLDRVGRRWPLCGSMLLGGLSCICTMFVPPSNGWVISGLAFVGKFGIAASFCIIYIFAGELYPTVVRAIGMGMSSMVAGSGLILAPYLVNLGEVLRILPLLIMGTLTLAAGVASMFLPETLGSHLPQTIQDAENFGIGFPFCYCPSKGNLNHDMEMKESRHVAEEQQDFLNSTD